MTTARVEIRRLSIVSSKPFGQVIARLTSTIGRPDMALFRNAVAAAKTIADLEAVLQGAIGSSGLIEFIRFDVGEILRKELGRRALKSVRLVIGNPIIMKEIVKRAPDAASYAPVTVLIDERADGVHLSYDLLASLIAPYGNQDALAIAKDLDLKVERLLESAA